MALKVSLKTVVVTSGVALEVPHSSRRQSKSSPVSRRGSATEVAALTSTGSTGLSETAKTHIEEAAKQAAARVRAAQLIAKKEAKESAAKEEAAVVAAKEAAAAKAAKATVFRLQTAARLEREEAARREAEQKAKDAVTAEMALASAAAAAAARSSAAQRLAKEVQATMQVVVTSAEEGEQRKPLDVAVPLELRLEGNATAPVPLPVSLAAGGGAAATCVAGGPQRSQLAGELSIGGARLGFVFRQGADAAEPGRIDSYVVDPLDGQRLLRVTVVSVASGVTVEAKLDPERRRLEATARAASVFETRRQEAAEALAQAEAGADYDLLHAKLTTARARGLNQRRLDAAAERLRRLQPDLAEASELSAALVWARVTPGEAGRAGEACAVQSCQRPGCALGLPLPGEQLSFTPRAADEALAPLARGRPAGVAADQWLFERLAEAALAALPRGGVWRSGGKYILSAPSRNQAPAALHRFLVGLGQASCAGGVDALVKWVEARHAHRVSAVQINLHLDASHYHAQHRDIYGLEQRDKAGRDCTCSFKPNVATACLSLGSARRCLVEALTDEFSCLKPCCAECTGHARSHWLRSGDLMYFNDAWNRSHSHGIPPCAADADAEGVGVGGPRISVALLCAAADGADAVCSLKGKPKNIYSTLVDEAAKASLFESEASLASKPKAPAPTPAEPPLAPPAAADEPSPREPAAGAPAAEVPAAPEEVGGS